ncbi:hypothetical protein CJF32_00011332 [Rutstroemia sp. NJR-2017a WRK4]|nr:hypothetical protein CJF32_00011332 [Rutstroemia sp. NJR-2017a WRK4]
MRMYKGLQTFEALHCKARTRRLPVPANVDIHEYPL